MYHHKVTALCNVQLDNRLISLDILSTILLTIYLNHKDKKRGKTLKGNGILCIVLEYQINMTNMVG